MSEQQLIYHCAPTLAGIKTGNLFSVPCQNKAELNEGIRRLNRRLAKKGVRIVPMRYSERWALLYVYRPRALSEDLSDAEVCKLMQDAGYGECTPNRCVCELSRRLKQREEFPHEIGLFLSYPLEDVKGFIEHRGNNYKCSGCWKVYGDPDQAQKTFATYKHCTACCCARWEEGTSLESLTAAG